MEDIDIHYTDTDEDVIVQALAAEWPRICGNAAPAISQFDATPPCRIVVLVRPDCGLLFFTLESDGDFVTEIACVSSQLLEDRFIDCDDDFSVSYALGRRIVKSSFDRAATDCDFSRFDLPIAVDDYQSADATTLEMLHE